MKLGESIMILRNLQMMIINNMTLNNINREEIFYAISTLIKEVERKYDNDEQ